MLSMLHSIHFQKYSAPIIDMPRQCSKSLYHRWGISKPCLRMTLCDREAYVHVG
jgi:hypothetical protein